MDIYHVRVETTNHGDEYNYFSFYNVSAPDKHVAGIKARKQFCEDFGGKVENCKAAYIWDAGVLVDFKYKTAI